MEESLLLAPIAFIILSLMAGALLKLVLDKINLPYTVGLFLLGMIVGTLQINGVIDGAPVINEAIDGVCNIDPDLILNIFLPILIFSAAYELDVHIFKKTLVNASLLAVPGMIIAMMLTAALMIGVSHIAPAYVNWNWTFALMFGALISATDPVAVVALLGELGVSKRFSTLIDGESMLNDGTGIVLFMLMYAPFTASVESTHASPVISFLVVVFGGLLIGYLLARAYLFYATRKGVRGDALLQTSVMILLSYLTFILAQDIFKLSGVIALVAFGLAVAYHGSTKLDERAQHFMREFWGLLSYIANTLIFIIIGVIIAVKVNFTWSDLAVLMIVYLGINIVRMAMIALLYPLLKRCGYGLSKRESMILTWGALRGALALTLALMVSYTDSIPEDVRRQVLLLTSGIVTLTLVINATTIKWMLGKLGLLKESASRRIIAADIRAQLHSRSEAYLKELQSTDGMESADWSSISKWLPQSVEIPAEVSSKRDFIAGLRMQIIAGERQVVWSLFNNGVIAVRAQRKLISALDAMIDQEGNSPLDSNITNFDLSNNTKRSFERWAVDTIRNIAILRIWSLGYFSSRDIAQYEFAYGTLLAQRRAMEIVDDMSHTTILGDAQMAYLNDVRTEIGNTTRSVEAYIAQFKQEHPRLYDRVITERARRMLCRYERKTIDNFVATGALDREDAESLISEVRQSHPSDSF